MSANSAHHWIVLGHDHSALLAALYLRRSVPLPNLKVSVVALPFSHPYDIVCSTDSLRRFHQQIGLSEHAFVRGTGADFQLACRYRDWGHDQHDFMLGDADYGYMLQRTRFQHCLNALGDTQTALDHYSLVARLARTDRFTPPSPKGGSIFNSIRYGYRFFAKRYWDFLLAQIPALGMDLYQVDHCHLESRDANHIALRLHTHSEQRVILKGEFCLDATESGIVKHQCFPTRKNVPQYQGWDVRVATKPLPTDTPRSVWYECLNTPEGIALQCQHQGHAQTLSLSPVNTSDSAHWVDDSPWVENCLAFGPGVSNRPPLFLDNLHLALSALARLRTLWPQKQGEGRESHAFNAATKQEWRIFEMIDALHLHAAAPVQFKMLEPAASALAVFESCGVLPNLDNDFLREYHWLGLFNALGWRAGHNRGARAGLDVEALASALAQMRDTLDKAVAASPLYVEFLKNNRL